MLPERVYEIVVGKQPTGPYICFTLVCLQLFHTPARTHRQIFGDKRKEG